MKFISAIATCILTPFVPIVFLLFVTLATSVLFNIAGLLFGFEKSSQVCKSLNSGKISNIQYYSMPIANYACEENGGLLQPAVSDSVHWLGEPHKKDS